MEGFTGALAAAGVEVRVVGPATGGLGADESKIDLAHFHGCTDRAGRRLLRASAKRGLPCLVSTHGGWTPADRRPGSWWQRLFGGSSGVSLPAGTCVHAATQHEANHLRELRFRGRIEVLPLGVDVATPASPQQAGHNEHARPEVLNASSEGRVLLYLGPMDAEPGLRLFLKACDDLEDSLAGWRIVLAGSASPEWQELLAAAARRHGKAQLATLVPSPSAAEQAALLRAADMLVSPIAGDRPAIDALFGMACGLPVLVSDHAGLDEIADRNAGRICPIDRAALRQALGELVALPAESLKAMGAAGRALVEERFAWPVLAPRYVELYRSLLK